MKRSSEVERLVTLTRCGSAMVFALVALLVASMLIAALLRTASLSHRQLKRDEFRIQASLLADAGSARAFARLRGQADFSGEDWNVPAEQLSADRTAVVHLKVTPASDQTPQRKVSVVAEYPLGNPDIVRISREIPIP